MTDVIIIGAGPAGMTAAMYATRAGVSVLLFDSTMYGGQIANTPEVENYPGIAKAAGWELAQKMYEQISDMGIEIRFEQILSIEQDENAAWRVNTPEGSYDAKTIVIANGAKRRKMGCKGEEELLGRGISFCASCDGSFFKDKIVAVVGGGNTALEDALYLANICTKVYLVHRRNEFRGQQSLVDAVVASPKIEICYSYVPDEVLGVADGKVIGFNVRKKTTGDSDSQSASQSENDGVLTLPVDGIFVAIGLDPENSAFESFVNTDEYGYIIADETCHTNAPGIFVAGDSRTKPLRQIVTACADGAVAANEAVSYINSKQ